MVNIINNPLEVTHMKLIGKLVNFIMSTISNWIGNNELIRDIFKIKEDNKNDD